MAFSKARRLGDLVSTTGEVSAFVDASIVPADLHATLDLTGKTITVATASANDNDTTVASTAFVQQELASLVDSAPGTLNTLNELAAALGDDANFSTTVTNSIATKLPLAGGTLTGNLIITTAEPKITFTDSDNSAQAFISQDQGNLNFSADSGSGVAGTNIDFITDGTLIYRISNGMDLLASVSNARIGSSAGHVEYGTSAASNVKFFTNDTEKARITSDGYLLVGKTDTSFTTNGVEIRGGNLGARVIRQNAEPLNLHRQASDGDILKITKDSTHVGSLGSSSDDFVLTSLETDKDILFKGDDGGSAITALTLDMSDAGTATFNNNIGLGAAPNLHSGRKALQIYNSSFVGATDRLQLYDNIYYDGSDFKMITTGPGTLKNQYNGSHLWYNASSVSAGATANVFERMRLTPSGDLCIGGTNETHTSADIGTSIHLLSEVTGTDVSLHLHPDVGEYSLYAYNGYLAILDHTANAERMRLDSSGNVGINNNNPSAAKLVVKSAGGGTERTFQTTDASDNETFWIQGGGATGLQYWPFYVGKSSTATGNAYTRSGEYIQAQGPIAGGKNGRYIHDWWGPQITGNHSYLHLVTKMWGGGSPHGNTEYIMGGFMITGYRYTSGTKQHRAMHQFHNWSGSLYYHGVVDDGDWTGASHVYVNSDGFVTVRLQGGNYYMYTIDFVQYNQYDKHDVGISAATGSANATI